MIYKAMRITAIVFSVSLLALLLAGVVGLFVSEFGWWSIPVAWIGISVVICIIGTGAAVPDEP